MKKLTTLVFIPLLFIAFSAYSFPGKHHGKHHRKHHQWWKKSEVVDQLNLSDQQISEIEEIASSFKANTESLRDQVRTDYKAFKELMSNPNSSRAEILAAFDKAASTKQQLKRASVEMRLDVREVLTPDQITKLYEIKKERREKMKERWKERKEQREQG